MSHCGFVNSFPEYVLDRTIVIGKGHEHRVSGYKLAKASEFFRSQLREMRVKELERFKQTAEGGAQPPQRSRTRSLSEMESERIEVTYGDSGALEYVLSFIHCGHPSLTVSLGNITSILKAALHFKVGSLIDFCFEEIHRNIDIVNCWLYCAISREFRVECPQLVEFVDGFILENFMDATESEYFLKVGLGDLRGFLRDDRLNIREEVGLLEVIGRWAEHGGVEKFPELLGCLRLGRLREGEVEVVGSNRLVVKAWGECGALLGLSRESPGGQGLSQVPVGNLGLSKVVPGSLGLSRVSPGILEHGPPPPPPHRTESDLHSLVEYLHRPRAPREALVVVGGWEGNQDDPNFGPSKAIQVYDNRADCWKRIVGEKMGLDEGHAYSGCVLHKNKIYVIGGYVASGPTQTLKMFDLSVNQWKYLSPMHEKRNYITTCLLDDFIYTIGGHNGRNRLSSVERYDPSQNHWSFVCPMRQVRSDAGCDSLQGKLYVCGGFDGHHFYASVEMYDPKIDQWSSVAPMSNIRSGVSVITYKNFMFAIGGNDGLQRLRTVERYDPVTNRWLTMPSMIRQRSNFCLAVLEDEIYVMGGWSDETNSTIALVEKWLPGLSNLWVSVQQLFMPASANCCCTVKGIDNIRELFNN